MRQDVNILPVSRMNEYTWMLMVERAFVLKYAHDRRGEINEAWKKKQNTLKAGTETFTSCYLYGASFRHSVRACVRKLVYLSDDGEYPGKHVECS